MVGNRSMFCNLRKTARHLSIVGVLVAAGLVVPLRNGNVFSLQMTGRQVPQRQGPRQSRPSPPQISS
jgi:hypothetical protein